jgi:hypothetical protein
MSASGGAGESKPNESFQTDLKYAIYYIGKVLNDNDPDDLDKDLKKLDMYIKDLKLNFTFAKRTNSPKFAADIDFAEQALNLDERVRTLKTAIAKIRDAAEVLVEAVDADRRRSSSPFTPPHIFTAKDKPLSAKDKEEMVDRLSSPPPFLTGAATGASAAGARRTPSPRLSSMSERAGSTSPYIVLQPSIAGIKELKDDIGKLKVAVKQHYLKIEKEMESQPKKAPPTHNRPNKPMG